MERYAELKEARLEEFREVVEPSFLLNYLSVRACRGGRKRFEEVRSKNDWELLLSSFQRSRIIGALLKAGYSFYTAELQRRRSELYRSHYGLICEAVKRASGGVLSDELFAEGVVAFLEALDNLLPRQGASASTYVFRHVEGRLKDYFERQKKGFTVVHYLSRFCGYENAYQLLSEGLVRVNGKVVRNPKKKVSLTDEILVGEERPLAQPVALSSSCVPDYEEELLKRELWERVFELVGPEKGKALKMKMEGYSAKEIARELGTTSSGASQMVKEAVRKLKKVGREGGLFA